MDTHPTPTDSSLPSPTPVEPTANEGPDGASSAPSTAKASAESDAKGPVDPDAMASSESDAKASAVTDAAADPDAERRRLKEQLDALERKQTELRRALAIAEHPGLAEALRAVEGRVYAVTRAEAKRAQGLSKAEERRRETLEKKLGVARARRDELDAQVAELERELAPLGEARRLAAEGERTEALEALVHALGAHEAAFRAAGLEVAALLPDVARWLPEIRATAEAIVARGQA